MSLKIVNVPSVTGGPILKSPGFKKKHLADRHMELMALCGFGCAYCSSNDGNYLRINRKPFADLTERQLGERLLPATSPELTFAWPDIEDRLEEQLRTKPKKWGAGETLILSQLTDPFTGPAFKGGATRRVMKRVIDATSFRIRVLTKNSVVGLSKEWLEFFASHADRFVVGLSCGSVDDAWAERVEVNCPPPSARLKALRALQDAGVPTFGMLCPIFPDSLWHLREGGRLDELVDAIRPDRCETVWAEPYNDRNNWRAVRAGYEEGSPGWTWMTRVYEERAPGVWSDYATMLLCRLRERAALGGWIHKLKYLLYEGGITEADAQVVAYDLDGVLLQDAPDPKTGRSRHPAFAAAQSVQK